MTGARSTALIIAAVLVAAGLFAAEIITAANVDLMFDEAYYWTWSRHLSWGYFDHPPMVALWIWLSTTLFGSSELGLRALGVIGSAAGALTVGWLAFRLLGSLAAAALASLMWSAMLLIDVGAIVVTPDTPLVTFWMLGLAGLIELWRSGHARWWALIGLGVGLALLSKFTAAFLGAGIVLSMILVPSLRRWWISPAPYLAGVLSVLIFSPFLAWNASHHWVTLVKQLGRAEAKSFEPRFLLELIGAQVGLMNPLVFVLVAISFAGLLATFRAPVTREGEARRLLWSSVAPAILYFLIHALHARVQGNWLAPLYPAFAILAADTAASVVAPDTEHKARVTRFARAWAVPLGATLALVAFIQAGTGVIPLGPTDPTARLAGWHALARFVDRMAEDQKSAFIAAPGYALTSLLRFYTSGKRPVEQLGERIRWIFEPDPPAAVLNDGEGLVVAEEARHLDADLKTRFEDVDVLARIDRLRGATVLDTYLLYRVARPKRPVLDPVVWGRDGSIDTTSGKP